MSVIAHEKFTGIDYPTHEFGVSTQSDVNQSYHVWDKRGAGASYRSAEFSALVALNQLVGRQLDREMLSQNWQRTPLPNDIIAKLGPSVRPSTELGICCSGGRAPSGRD